jgi:hypothetical protein
LTLASSIPPRPRQLEGVPKIAVERIMGHFKKAGSDVNGWIFTTKTGLNGTDYLQRALVTAIGLGANRPQDAVYPTSEMAADGKPYEGTNKYVVHFPKGQMPPANAFWSLTMYNAEYFFVDNPLNRYTLSSRDTLKPNADGSTDLYIQSVSPGPDKESSWLPAPPGRFILMMRLYWPKETDPSILKGTWKLPAGEAGQLVATALAAHDERSYSPPLRPRGRCQRLGTKVQWFVPGRSTTMRRMRKYPGHTADRSHRSGSSSCCDLRRSFRMARRPAVSSPRQPL